MEPRGYLGTFIMAFSVFTLPVILLGTFLVSLYSGETYGEVLFPNGFLIGMIAGIIFGITTSIQLHVKTIRILFQSEKDFLNDLNVYLARIGYIPEAETKHINRTGDSRPPGSGSALRSDRRPCRAAPRRRRSQRLPPQGPADRRRRSPRWRWWWDE